MGAGYNSGDFKFKFFQQSIEESHVSTVCAVLVPGTGVCTQFIEFFYANRCVWHKNGTRLW
ncbi:hypothetical protein CCFV1_ORF035 [Cotesia congregata filamentous virus 1]|uniref:Uncharacterized protein n=1 Tax=Cotesia congregata filamentous virus 1 TaxID=3064291 RepID=A0ABC8QJM1_9VIRU|nr:hypothetical protein CCFV1_ORF035 [Cotesia congregata filamentous virus 1]